MPSPKVTALLCAAAAFCGSLLVAPAALASSNQIDFFEAPQQLLYTAGRAQAIPQLESLGVRALRIQLIWQSVAPSPNATKKPNVNLANPANYNWGQYVPLIEEAQSLGWKVLLTVTGAAPCWASGCATAHIKHETKKQKLDEIVTNPNPIYYGQFMQAVGKEFGSYVKLYSVWNEPNQPQMLLPQYVGNTIKSAAIYRQLFLKGYAGLQASGNASGAKVLMGETAPLGVRIDDIVAPLPFMRAVLCLNSNYVKAKSCGKLPAAGYAQHPYFDKGQGPFWNPPSGDVSINTLGRLSSALSRAADAGAIPKNLPIYITEFGVQSQPNQLLGVPVAEQAEWDAISERVAWDNPRVASFSQYLLTDDTNPGEGSFQTGLEYVNGKPKPLYNGYRLPLTVTVEHGSSVAFWGLVRPASATTSIDLQYSDNNGTTWQQLLSAQTNANGYWTASGRFASHRLWRVQWTAPDGTQYVGASTRAYVTGSSKPQS
jgi:hypothetical protein